MTKNTRFWRYVEELYETIAPSSQRVYQRTFEMWERWCRDHNHNDLDLDTSSVRLFLVSNHDTRVVRKARLSHVRSLGRIMALDRDFPLYKDIYERLRLIRIPLRNIKEYERDRIILDKHQIEAVLDVWGDLSSPLHVRNRMILLVMLYTGIRRNELLSLMWADIDFEDGILRIRHGKGDKYREVAIVSDNGDRALTALMQWKVTQMHIYQGGRKSPDRLTEFIIPSLSSSLLNNTDFLELCGAMPGFQPDWVVTPMRRGNVPYSDFKMSEEGFDKLVRNTRKMAETTFKSHDLRRTHGTRLLMEHVPIPDVQAQLGHQNAATTIDHYGVPADARRRRKNMTVGY